MPVSSWAVAVALVVGTPPYFGATLSVGQRSCTEVTDVVLDGPAWRGGLRTGDCIVSAQTAPADAGGTNLCVALDRAVAGDRLIVGLQGGQTRNIQLADCTKATFLVTVSVETGAKRKYFDVPRATTVGDVLRLAGVHRDCRMTAKNMCGGDTAPLIVDKVPPLYRFDSGCYFKVALDCADHSNEAVYYLQFSSGYSSPIVLRVGDQPPREWRCVARRGDERWFDCVGRGPDAGTGDDAGSQERARGGRGDGIER